MKYPMAKKTDRPIFNYMVTENGEEDYYLYFDFDSALKKAIELSNHSTGIGLVYEIAFNNETREFFGHNTFTAYDGEVHYDKHSRLGLHIHFYINAGNWLNPNEDWLTTLNKNK